MTDYVPERYRQAIETDHATFEIPLHKVIFVGDKKEAIAISYKDQLGETPHCVLQDTIDVPNYESVLNGIAQEHGSLTGDPFLFT